MSVSEEDPEVGEGDEEYEYVYEDDEGLQDAPEISMESKQAPRKSIQRRLSRERACIKLQALFRGFLSRGLKKKMTKCKSPNKKETCQILLVAFHGWHDLVQQEKDEESLHKESRTHEQKPPSRSKTNQEASSRSDQEPNKLKTQKSTTYASDLGVEGVTLSEWTGDAAKEGVTSSDSQESLHEAVNSAPEAKQKRMIPMSKQKTASSTQHKTVDQTKTEVGKTKSTVPVKSKTDQAKLTKPAVQRQATMRDRTTQRQAEELGESKGPVQQQHHKDRKKNG